MCLAIVILLIAQFAIYAHIHTIHTYTNIYNAHRVEYKACIKVCNMVETTGVFSYIIHKLMASIHQSYSHTNILVQLHMNKYT